MDKRIDKIPGLRENINLLKRKSKNTEKREKKVSVRYHDRIGKCSYNAVSDYLVTIHQ